MSKNPCTRATRSTLLNAEVLPVSSRFKVTGRRCGASTPTSGAGDGLILVAVLAARQPQGTTANDRQLPTHKNQGVPSSASCRTYLEPALPSGHYRELPAPPKPLRLIGVGSSDHRYPGDCRVADDGRRPAKNGQARADPV